MDFSEAGVPCQPVSTPPDSLIERCHWLYALFREYVFRDQTEEIKDALFDGQAPAAGTQLLELGCGPGFYARRFAWLYPQMGTTGVDLSKALIEWAKAKAQSSQLMNCSFFEGDAQALPPMPHRVDAVIVSRLFLIVPDKQAVLAEIFRVLRPGGRCFIAEPLAGFTTRLPLSAMWFLTRFFPGPAGKYREPQQADVMSEVAFKELVATQPWASMDVHCDGWYQYAVCMKPEDDEDDTAAAETTAVEHLSYEAIERGSKV